MHIFDTTTTHCYIYFFWQSFFFDLNDFKRTKLSFTEIFLLFLFSLKLIFITLFHKTLAFQLHRYIYRLFLLFSYQAIDFLSLKHIMHIFASFSTIFLDYIKNKLRINSTHVLSIERLTRN